METSLRDGSLGNELRNFRAIVMKSPWKMIWLCNSCHTFPCMLQVQEEFNKSTTARSTFVSSLCMPLTYFFRLTFICSVPLQTPTLRYPQWNLMLFGFNSNLVAQREASYIQTRKCRGFLNSRRDPRLRMRGGWTPRPNSFIALPFLTLNNFFPRLRFLSLLYACQFSSAVWWSTTQLRSFALRPGVILLGAQLI